MSNVSERARREAGAGQGIHVGIVGATGVVGERMRALLDERDFPVERTRLFASARSAGKRIAWRGCEIEVEEATAADYTGLDVVFFSAGGPTSRAIAERVGASGAVVIDNTSFLPIRFTALRSLFAMVHSRVQISANQSPPLSQMPW